MPSLWGSWTNMPSEVVDGKQKRQSDGASWVYFLGLRAARGCPRRIRSMASRCIWLPFSDTR
jgi:hypothetical protein